MNNKCFHPIHLTAYHISIKRTAEKKSLCVAARLRPTCWIKERGNAQNKTSKHQKIEFSVFKPKIAEKIKQIKKRKNLSSGRNRTEVVDWMIKVITTNASFEANLSFVSYLETNPVVCECFYMVFLLERPASFIAL